MSFFLITAGIVAMLLLIYLLIALLNPEIFP